MIDIVLHPFTLGLVLGILLSLVLILNISIKLKHSRNENLKLKEHLQTKLELDAEANEMRKKDTHQLREENENLRISIQTLMQKPKKQEIKLLYVYDKAVNLMQERAPGFAPVWQSVFKEAEEDIAKSLKGVIPFLRRVIRPSSTIALSEGATSNEGVTSNQDKDIINME